MEEEQAPLVRLQPGVIGAGSAGLVPPTSGSKPSKGRAVEKHKMGGDCLKTGSCPRKR